MSEWIWIDERDALAIHERLLLLHGGAAALRDQGLLQSALARPRNLAGYNPAADLFQLAAAYTAGIVQNHPFVDGNKRTGFVVGVLFLELNGARFTAAEEDATQAVTSLAAGALREEDYAAFRTRNVDGG